MESNGALKWAGLGLAAIVGLALLYVSLTPEPTGGQHAVSEAAPRGPEVPRAAKRLEAVPPDPGDGPDDEGSELRPGMSVGGVRVPPSIDPHAWQQQRVVMSADLRERTLEATRQWAEAQGLDFDTTEELLGVWDTMFDAMAATRPPAAATVKEAMRAQRLADQAQDDAHEALEVLLGAEDAAALLEAIRSGP